MKDLIDPAKRDWRVNLVKSTFHDHDAQEILNIRIPKIIGEDQLVWQPDKLGTFFVKSAYNLALSRIKPHGYWFEQPTGW